MNEFEAGFLLGRISRIMEDTTMTPSMANELNSLKFEIVKFMKEKKK